MKQLGKVREEGDTLFIDCGFCGAVLFQHKVDPSLDTPEEVGAKFMLSPDFKKHLQEKHFEEIAQGLATDWIDTPPEE